MQDELICIYGENDEKFYSFLKKSKKRIIFLEDDKKKFDLLLSQVKKHFRNKRTEAVFLGDNPNRALKEIAWRGTYSRLTILKSAKEKRQSFQKIFDKLQKLHLGVNLVAGLYSDYGHASLKNVYLNLLLEGETTLFESYFNKFKNIPAVIVGAGPSLEKNLPLLNLVYNKALIFAGGTALNILSKNNIKCHATGFVDPISSFERSKKNHFFENMLFYQNQVHHNILKTFQAKKILVAEHGAHPLESWIHDKCNIKQELFEGGWNVSTFLMKVAAFLGCNPIILVGVDLCYKKDKYAENIIREKDKYKLVKFNVFKEDVFTQKDWLLAKDWMEEFAFLNKKTKFINASEGLFIKHLKNESFLDVIKNDLKLDMDLLGLVHSVFESQKKIKVDKDQVKKNLKVLLVSLNRASDVCDEYLSKLEFDDRDYNFIRLRQEIAYSFLLEPNWLIWKHVILRKIKNEKLDIFINQIIFFKNVILDHLKILGKVL